MLQPANTPHANATLPAARERRPPPKKNSFSLVGIEILDASRHTDNPRALEYAVESCIYGVPREALADAILVATFQLRASNAILPLRFPGFLDLS